MIDLTWLSYVIAAIVLYYVALFLASTRPRAAVSHFGYQPLFVIMVPARNEALVLDATLERLSKLAYRGSYRVLVLNDASTDETSEIAHGHARIDPRIRILDRSPAEGGRGKSAVLNHGYRVLRQCHADADPWLEGRDPGDIVVGIVDADGRLDPSCLEVVAPYFERHSVGTTQVGVRIFNARASLLARMQDMEFVAFSWLVQIARDRLGSAGAGGNGQFNRLSALGDLGDAPWETSALTEDLDLGLQLVAAGWTTRYCHLTYVEQQGLERWRPLLRQRTRWIQGHYQSWRRIPQLARARHVPLRTRLDLIGYLLLVVTVMLVAATLVLGLLGGLGLIPMPTSRFLVGIVPDGLPYRGALLSLSLLPLAMFMTAYQLHSPNRFRWYEVPAAAAAFTLYTYVWVLVTLRAWWRLALRRNGWVKTPRVALLPGHAQRGSMLAGRPTEEEVTA